MTGRTDNVVVVGAGLGGLSAALRLAGAGRSVTVLEREAVPGGRAGLLSRDGYAFDTGPTVLTMPHLLDEALACVGEKLDDWLELIPIDPLYRGRFADGSTIDVRAGVDAMAAEVEDKCGLLEADGYRRFAAFVTELYELEMRTFIDRNLDNPLQLMTPELARLAGMGGFRRLAPKVASYLRDERLQRLFSFQAMYAGLSPYNALAIYAVIAYMDSVAGVYFPRGGMHAVPRALAAAASKHGVDIRYNTEVISVERAPGNSRRAVAVHTANGERIPADVIVLNPDLPVAYRDLLGETPWHVRRLRYSPSCVVLLAGSRLPSADVHHTISFGKAWRSTFTQLIDSRQLMSDPSLLVTCPTTSDPALAPNGRSSYYVLFPTPNLGDGTQSAIDWRAEGPRYREHMLRTLEGRDWPGFEQALDVDVSTTPLDWQARGMEQGAPFAASHTFTQTGPFRPKNLWGENVVFTGSGTQPGVGVPMVLISGRLAVERIVGPTT